MKTNYPKSSPLRDSFRWNSERVILTSETGIQVTRSLNEEEAKWLLSYRDTLITLLLFWCSDFNWQDAEDVVSDLFDRICEHGIGKTIGSTTEANLFYHLRREKENVRRRRGRIKRGGNVIHLNWDGLSHESSLESEGLEAILTRSDYRLLDDYLQLLLVESTGRLRVVVLAMRRILDRYQTPSDLVEVLTDEERAAFHPCDERALSDEELDQFILTAVTKALEKLRQRLRELREKIPMN